MDRDSRSLDFDTERSTDRERPPFDFERERDLESRFSERDLDRESRLFNERERERDFDLDLERSRRFDRDLEREFFAGDLDLLRLPRDFDRLRDFERLRDDLERERLCERDRERLLEDRERPPRPLPPAPLPRPPPRLSSTNRTRRPFNSVSSNFSMAFFISETEANSTTPSLRRCLWASAYVTSPA